MSNFLSESQIYELLATNGLGVPRYYRLTTLEDIADISFASGEDVVIKGEVEDIFHKSDVGLVRLTTFDVQEVKTLFTQWKQEFADRFKSLLVIERVKFTTVKGFPTECFFSIAYDDSYGYVARLGIGGIHSEFWAKQYPPMIITKDDVLNDVLERLSNHLLGHLWFGLLRQQEALLPVDRVKSFLQSIQKLLAQKNLPELLEVNPFVISNDQLIALDGVGIKQNRDRTGCKTEIKREALLTPSRVALAGVSTTKKNFGSMILDNILQSQLSIDAITLIKPGLDSYKGCRCIASVTDLKEQAVDALIIALPPRATVDMVEQLCLNGGGADIVYLVAGGIGDGADSSGEAKRLADVLTKYRDAGKWTPRLVGPNSLGIVLSNLSFNSLFIPPEKLEVHFAPQGNLAFLSQSGAFFITRLSTMPELPTKYAFCIGNQFDVTMGELLEVCSGDQDVDVFSIYLEGIKEGDLYALTKVISRLRTEQRRVVVYKGGRSAEGAKAAAGHTGAMASAYDFIATILQQAGADICHTIEEFSLKTLFFSKYREEIKSIGVISNAGFESVRSADIFAERLKSLTQDNQKKLDTVFQQAKLAHLISANNPLDLTPMADEQVYLSSVEVMLEQYDAVVLGVVPLTERLDTSDSGGQFFARELKKLSLRYKKPIIVAIDAGKQYQVYRQQFAQEGIITFCAIEKSVLLF